MSAIFLKQIYFYKKKTSQLSQTIQLAKVMNSSALLTPGKQAELVVKAVFNAATQGYIGDEHDIDDPVADGLHDRVAWFKQLVHVLPQLSKEQKDAIFSLFEDWDSRMDEEAGDVNDDDTYPWCSSLVWIDQEWLIGRIMKPLFDAALFLHCPHLPDNKKTRDFFDNFAYVYCEWNRTSGFEMPQELLLAMRNNIKLVNETAADGERIFNEEWDEIRPWMELVDNV